MVQPVHLHQHIRATSALARPHHYPWMFTCIETATERAQRMRARCHTRATRARKSASAVAAGVVSAALKLGPGIEVYLRGGRVLLTETLLPRIDRQAAVCLISIRGSARKTRIEKFELDEDFQPYPPFRVRSRVPFYSARQPTLVMVVTSHG